MKLYNRILHILIAIILICVALLLLILGEDGKSLIALIMGGALLIYGIRSLGAYFLKFRYTVGGRMQLYIGIIMMDVGLLFISSFNGSSVLILIYLLVFQLATGAIGVARALEARKNKSSWKLRMTAGMISLATVLLGLIFFRQPDAVVDIYCIGLLFSAIEHFITAFRRNKIVTIA